MARLIILEGYSRASRIPYTLAMASAMRERGVSVTVYTPDRPAADALFRRAGIDLRHAPLKGFTDYSTIKALSRHLADEPGGATIVSTSFRGAFIAMSARLLSMRGDLNVVHIQARTEGVRASWLARRVFGPLQGVVFTSEMALRAFVVAWGARLPLAPSRLHVIADV